MQVLIDPLESDVESKVSKYAEEKGCMSLKLVMWGRRGWPDHIFLRKPARVLFVEFKRRGEKPRKLQEFIHGKLRDFGFQVEVVDNVVQGKGIIDRFTASN